MDDRGFHVLETLQGVRESLGERAYREAVRLALRGIGIAVHREAERRGRSFARRRSANIVRFPLGRRRHREE